MSQNNIQLSTANHRIPGFEKNNDNTESFTTIPESVELKIKTCFYKLMNELTKNNRTLR